MVRDVWLHKSLALLVCLPAMSAVSAEQSGFDQTTNPPSAYTKAELAKRGQSSNQVRSLSTRQSPQLSLPFVYDRRRAATSLREISDHVSKMKQRSMAARATIEFDAQRAADTLQRFKDFVTEMKQRTKATQRTTTGPFEDVQVRHYNRVRVPTPQRIEETSGLTHQEFAEVRLREKGYVKTTAGWVPPQQQERVSQQQPKRKSRKSVAQSSSSDPF